MWYWHAIPTSSVNKAFVSCALRLLSLVTGELMNTAGFDLCPGLADASQPWFFAALRSALNRNLARVRSLAFFGRLT
jgi:hypothetical protein